MTELVLSFSHNRHKISHILQVVRFSKAVKNLHFELSSSSGECASLWFSSVLVAQRLGYTMKVAEGHRWQEIRRNEIKAVFHGVAELRPNTTNPLHIYTKETRYLV